VDPITVSSVPTMTEGGMIVLVLVIGFSPHGERCREVGERDIEEIIDCFVKSIERAK
jgi:hypothetical protein